MCALAKQFPLIFLPGFIGANPETLDTRGRAQVLRMWWLAQAASAAKSELSSVLADGGNGQESGGVGYKAGKSDTPEYANSLIHS